MNVTRTSSGNVVGISTNVAIRSGYSPYIGDDGYWYVYNDTAKKFVKTEYMASGGSITPEQIESAINSYLAENPISSVTMADVEQAIIDSIADKTEKTRIEFDGTNFKLDGVVLNYKQLYDVHLAKPDFAFVTYGDRAYLLSYVQEDAGMKEMRFQSVLAVTDSSNLSYVKTSGIYVTSTNGVTISSVKVTDINGENKSYKATTIDNTNENSDVWYPSVKAVADYVKEQNGNKVEQTAFELLVSRVRTLEENTGIDIPDGEEVAF